MLRIRKFSIVVLVAIVLVACISCATFDSNAYKTLGTAKVSYNQVMSALGSLQAQGKLKDADVQKILPFARAYYQAYLIAESAYEVYHANPSVANQDQLIKLLTDVSVKIGELSAILIPYNIAVSQITVPTK